MHTTGRPVAVITLASPYIPQMARTLHLALLLFLAAGLAAQSPRAILTDFLAVENGDSTLSLNALARLDALAVALRGKYRPNRPQKSLERLFTTVHDELFVRYVDNPVFADIFRKGQYNCVTASAVFAYLFEQLAIPYAIVEEPTHVYVVAYPGTLDLIVEGTVPSQKELESRRAALENARDELLADKLITADEAASPEFMEQYFGRDTLIDLRGLYGVQLYNVAHAKTVAGDYFGALRYLDKAERYWKRGYLDQVKLTVLLFLLETGEKYEATDNCYLAECFYQVGTAVDADIVPALHGYLVQLIGEVKTARDVEAADRLVDCLAANALIPDTLLAGLRNTTDLATAYYLHQSLDHQGALDRLARSFRPDNNNSFLLIREVLAYHLNGIKDRRTGLDTLARYEGIFPFVRDDAHLQAYGVWCYAYLIKSSYDLGEGEEGKAYLEAFEARYAPGAGHGFSNDEIGMIYGAVSSYYVRRKEEAAARRWLERGLEYAGESFELRRKLKLLTSDSW